MVDELKAKIAEYEIVLKPVHPSDAERMQQWVPVENLCDIACARGRKRYMDIYDDGKGILIGSDDKGEVHFSLGENLRICRKVGGEQEAEGLVVSLAGSPEVRLKPGIRSGADMKPSEADLYGLR